MSDLKTTIECSVARVARLTVVVAASLTVVAPAIGQDTPLISGGAAFLTSTRGGNTTYLPIIEPVLAAPIGSQLLIESQAVLLDTISPAGNGKTGYTHSHAIDLSYLQGGFLLSPHVTVVAGSYLLPFNTYNERLSPVWIGNFQDGPTSASLGLLSTGTGVGGELRGSAVSRQNFSFDYVTWFSARSGVEQFSATRSVGGRGSIYLPESRLEAGFSYNRMLQGTQENFYGMHLWWEPKDTGLRFRSEYATGKHAQGYWVEADYRTLSWGNPGGWRSRFEPLFRIQQTFRRDTLASDNLPLVNTQRADFGVDYNLPHNTRILTSYSRRFASTGNQNIWETGIVYRFLFPAWKGRAK